MIIFIKKSSVFLLCTIFICVMMIAGIALGSIGVPATVNASYGKVVVIDAGHGEPDGGAAGADGTTEAGLNLLVAQKLNNLLLQSDIKTVMTRTTNEGIYDPSAKNITEKKRTDMRKRREIQSSVGADLFISIHMNQFEQSKYHGAQVVYDGKNAEAKRLAECIQSALREGVDPDNDRQAMKSDGSIYLLKNAPVPSVIVECGFLSNGEELEKLKTDEYQTKLAWAVMKGIEAYYAGAGGNGGATESVPQ